MAQPQPQSPEETRQLASPTWTATRRPQRGQSQNSSPAFTGNSPLDNWIRQGTDSDPWNGVGSVVAELVGGPQQARQEAEGVEDDWSTQATVGSSS